MLKIVDQHIKNIFHLVYLLTRVLWIVSTDMEHPKNLLKPISSESPTEEWNVSCPGRTPI